MEKITLREYLINKGISHSEIENNQINKYNILVGKMDEQGCGDLNIVFTTFNKKRAYEAFKNQIVTEKNDIKLWGLKRDEFIEIHLEQAIYDLEEEEEIETEDGPDILEIEKIRN